MLRAGLLLPVAATLLRVVGYKRAQSLLARAAPLRDGALVGDSAAIASATANTVNGVGSRLRFRCLSRSLTLWVLLRNRGIDTGLRIGVRKDGPALKAHAWVEHEGIPLGDVADGYGRFAGFPRFSSRSPGDPRASR